MLKSNYIENNYGEILSVPESIEKALLSLFSVKHLGEISTKELKNITQKMGMFTRFDSYKNKHKEYALYYFIVNFYKIWRPLLDLYYSGQLKEVVNILELGVGPGSTTFGLMEFYKHFDRENPQKQFTLTFVLIEQEKEFIDIFNTIFTYYKNDLPNNLHVKYEFKQLVINQSLSSEIFDTQFDLILESNMFNANENVNFEVIDNLLNQIVSRLSKHGSFISIEPVDDRLKNYLSDIRRKDKNYDLNTFSPCVCDKDCKQLCMAKSFIPNSTIISELQKLQILKNIKQFHYFEYIILRKDGLFKRVLENNKISLSNISNHIGEEISFNAYIIFATKKGKDFSIKVCDRSCEGSSVWVTIPSVLFYKNKLTELEVNRGCIIKLTKAKILEKDKICCDNNTKITIGR